MARESRDPLSEQACTEFLREMQGALSWQWDNRFQAALAQIDIGQKDTILGILEHHLGTAWNKATIDAAPEALRRATGRLGGIMPGQLLYAASLPEEGILFCAWWPWGNGKTVSIRLGASPEGAARLTALTTPTAG